MVTYFPTGAESVLARCVAAEVRAQLAKDRMNQREFAARLGFTSHNYISVRLREEKPFTLDDIDKMCALWDVAPEEFIQQAVESNLDRIMADLNEATAAGRAAEDLPTLAEKRQEKRSYAQPVKRAARKSTGKKKLEDE